MSNENLPPYGERLDAFTGDNSAPASWLELDDRDEFAWSEYEGRCTLVWRATGRPVIFSGGLLSYQIPMMSIPYPTDRRFDSAEPLTVAEHYRYILSHGNFDKTFTKMTPPTESES